MKKLLIHPEELTKVWIDRMAEHGVDILGLHPEGGNGAFKSAARLIEQVQQPDFRALIDYACDKGLQIEYELHAASYLLPRTLFEQHPEYFRMDEDGTRTTLVNFCVSNPDALEIFTDNAVKMAKTLYRSRPYYYFWMDDTKIKRCCCPKCAHLSFSDQQLLVTNALARKLRATIADAKVPYLAYHGTAQLPQKFRPEEGIFLEYAPMTRDMTQPASAVPAAERENIQALMAFFGENDATVLEYWYDNSMFSQWTKPPKAFVPRNDLIPGDVTWYTRIGFRHIASFACYLGADYERLHGQPDISAF